MKTDDDLVVDLGPEPRAALLARVQRGQPGPHALVAVAHDGQTHADPRLALGIPGERGDDADLQAVHRGQQAAARSAFTPKLRAKGSGSSPSCASVCQLPWLTECRTPET